MRPQEVSIVDAAANLRSWLVLKGLNMPNAQTAKVTKDEGALPPAAPPPQPGAPPAAPPPAADASPAETAKAAMKLPGAKKQELLDVLATVLEDLTATATAVGEAEVDDSAPIPPELGELLMRGVEGLQAAAATVAPAPADGGDPGAAPAEAPPAAVAAAAPISNPGATQSLEQAAFKAAVAKYGSRLARPRLASLKQSLALIQQVVNECDVTPAAVAEAAAGSPPAGGGDAGGGDAGVAKALEAIAASQVKLAEVVQAALAPRGTPVVKSIPNGNAQPTEGGAAPTKPHRWTDDLSERLEQKRAARSA